MDSEFINAIKSYADDPCAECGVRLGDTWTERYNARSGRLEKVHTGHPILCPDCGAIWHADHTKRACQRIRRG